MPSVLRVITFQSNLRKSECQIILKYMSSRFFLWPDASSYFKAISSCSHVKCWGSGQPELMEVIFSQVKHTFNFSIIVLFHLGTSILSKSLTGSKRRLGVNFTVQTLSNSFKNYIRWVTVPQWWQNLKQTSLSDQTEHYVKVAGGSGMYNKPSWIMASGNTTEESVNDSW